MEFIIILIACFVMGFAGYFIGKTKGRGQLGCIMGLFLGPIGWVVVLLMPADGGNALPADYMARRNSSRYGSSPEKRARDAAWQKAQSGE
jgi:hypothetical protein